jgi:multidrug resistance efflux pump
VKELKTERRNKLADETKVETTNETPTAEDYEAIKAELEAEKAKSQEFVAEATKDLQEKVTNLEAELATRTGELETLQTERQATSDELAGAKAAYAYAVEDYKQVVLQANPLFTPDIIGGDTIEDVKASVEKADALVGKVKEGLEARASALSQLGLVPAGAPARSAQSTEGLSTKEKINLGLEQARRARKGES